jgi:AcrR family transcriptional regulator
LADVTRPYALGKRAIQHAETRRRIVDAAIALYQEQGMSATTMLDVARRADVAPGTVANHFGSAEALAAVVTSEVLDGLRMPDASIFDGLDDPRERIHAFVRELSAFFERGQVWWTVSRKDAGSLQAWGDAEARFYRELDALSRAALGPLGGDDDAVDMVRTIMGNWVLGALQAGGRSEAAAIDLVTDLLAAWLATRPIPAAPDATA